MRSDSRRPRAEPSRPVLRGALRTWCSLGALRRPAASAGLLGGRVRVGVRRVGGRARGAGGRQQHLRPLRPVPGNPENDPVDRVAARCRLGVRRDDRVRRPTGWRSRRRCGRSRGGARGPDVSLMFYAGHGIETDGVNYVVPEDALARGALPDADVADGRVGHGDRHGPRRPGDGRPSATRPAGDGRHGTAPRGAARAGRRRRCSADGAPASGTEHAPRER